MNKEHKKYSGELIFFNSAILPKKEKKRSVEVAYCNNKTKYITLSGKIDSNTRSLEYFIFNISIL